MHCDFRRWRWQAKRYPKVLENILQLFKIDQFLKGPKAILSGLEDQGGAV